MDYGRDNAALPTLGFPIRESTGQRLFNASPWLIAVVHALLRLLVPRHPPCALHILTVIEPLSRSGSVIPELIWPTVQFSSSGEERHRRVRRRVVSQNSTACPAMPEPRPGRHARPPVLSRRAPSGSSLERR